MKKWSLGGSGMRDAREEDETTSPWERRGFSPVLLVRARWTWWLTGIAAGMGATGIYGGNGGGAVSKRSSRQGCGSSKRETPGVGRVLRRKASTGHDKMGTSVGRALTLQPCMASAG